jgi:hypothetical protein
VNRSLDQSAFGGWEGGWVVGGFGWVGAEKQRKGGKGGAGASESTFPAATRPVLASPWESVGEKDSQFY